MPKKTVDTEQERLIASLDQLDDRLGSLEHMFHPWHFLWYNFLRGIVYGLGILVAIAIVIPFVIAVLQRVEWIPILGDFLSEISERMQNANAF